MLAWSRLYGRQLPRQLRPVASPTNRTASALGRNHASSKGPDENIR
jgi:hypothetical protein